MPAPYPVPIINETGHLFTYANTVTGGSIMTSFMVASLVIIYFISRAKGFKNSDSFAVGFLLTLIFGALLWTMGLIQGQVLMIFVVFTIISTLWCVFDSR